ncbi:MAG TPA: MMPL family transporter [Xanthobacteraceae bacterium]|nr:MMPL family transporter [Xanthobacteraceae bacterium]
MKTITAFVVRTIAFCIYYHRWVVVGAIALAAASTWYAATHFAMTTDINQLISSNSPGRLRELAFEKAFPQFDTIIAVVDAPTPELVQQATAALVARLSQQKNFFRSVVDLQGSPFFAQNGLLFEPTDQLAPQLSMLSQAQRLIQVLAADPSLRGVVRALQFGLLGVQGGNITLDDMTWPMTLAANTFDQIKANQPASFSWRVLVQAHEAKPTELLRFVQLQAVLDYSELEPGLKASDAVRRAAADLKLASAYQARVRLTGPVPMNDDQFATIKENAVLNAVLTVAVVLCILWMALRWLRIIFAVFVSLVVGLSVTAAVGMLLVGTLNLISVYFAVLFVGLGVDFGIQFSVRYRAERHEVDALYEALLHAGRRAGAPLTLAGFATAAGFLSFLPTAYRGLSELGLIAGLGMLIAFISSISLLPALLSRLNPQSEPHPLGYAFLGPVDDFLERYRLPILLGTAVVILGASPLLYWLRFDFNPMNLRNPHVESVATYLELSKDKEGAENDIQVLEPALAQADQAAAKLRALPQVARVTTLSSFIPDDQQQKLPLIEKAAKKLDPALNPPAAAPPTDAENVAIINSTVNALNRLSDGASGPGAAAAKRLAAALALLAKADPATRQRAEAAFVPPLRTALDDLRNLLQAHEVTRDNLPPELVSQWVTPDGRARIEVAPSGHADDNATLRAFAHAVQVAEPNATEGPISILEARQTIITAFLEAGAYALLSIAVLLWITLRRVGDVLLTLIPLLVACVVTLEICVAIDLPLNFANIIALPLLLGVGVAFKIYYIMAWREGQTKLLQSVLTRAVTFSACTTATAFGSLYFSSDPGTSSMGKLLAISLMTTMMAAAGFQPVLMGKPRDDEARVHAQRRSVGASSN